jgi:hypothetical protein
MNRFLRFSPSAPSLGKGALLLVVGLSPALASCRQILGIKERTLSIGSHDDGGTTPQVTRCGGFTAPSSGCSRCMDKKCCDEASACEADGACKAAYECLQRCKPGDSDCAAWCLGSYSRPEALAKLTSCGAAQCASECGTVCGGLVNGANACDECVQQSCCAENTACGAHEACVDVDFCSHRCLPAGSITCSNLCATQYSDGSDEYATRNACIAANCADACSSKNAWSCLEHRPPALKPPTLDPITFNMTLVEFISEQPYAGIAVKACSQSDLNCAAPLQSTTTDENGAFSLSVPSGPSGFNGYIDLSGGALFPVLYYFVPPLIVGGERGRLRLPSTDTIGILTQAIGVTLDEKRGHLALVPWDCTLSPAPGVSLEIDSSDADATPYYFRQGVPNKMLKETDTAPALGGAVNLPARPAIVRATVTSLGVQSAELNFNVRAGTLTAGSIPPTP